jgi:zinc D-Ala-D-Ala carboxypeptidase
MKERRVKQIPIINFSIVIGILVVTTLFLYSYTRISSLSEQIEELAQELASSTAMLSEKNDFLSNNIEKTNNFTAEIARVLSDSNQTVSSFQQTVGEISNSIETLVKLSKTDPELLQKYSKIYFLNEHYTPLGLSAIERQHLYTEEKSEQIHTLVLPHLKNLLEAAAKENITIYIKSAYRSFEEQKSLKSSYRVLYGTGTANQFSADQGYSEHQLGTTVDFITTGLNGQLEGFEDTKAYQWLQNSAHKYGFTLSYPPTNNSYIFEPWHWRYVGIELATLLHDQNKYFYGLEQREIDEHLVNLFN